MPALPRLVLFVEGAGDRDALPLLVKQVLNELDAWRYLWLDPNPLVVKHLGGLTKSDGEKWLRYLETAKKRKLLGAVLLVLDGDVDTIRNEPFCAGRFAARLAEWSRKAGGGSLFSVACVFPRMEYESWLIACSHLLAERLLSPGNRKGVKRGTSPPEGDLETAPRDAKRWLGERMEFGYKPTRDQEPLTRHMINCLDAVRERNLRSFSRFENALSILVNAICSGNPVVSPAVSP